MKFILFFLLNVFVYAANNPNTIERDNWEFSTTNTKNSSTPSNLKYYKYFDILPDEINYKIFENQDLSHLAGKKLYVGYGTANQNGSDCKVFKAVDTGLKDDITVCLPWWRIEREYKSNESTNKTTSFLDNLKVIKAPLTVNYCKKWADGNSYPGGISVCTSYFDKNAGGDCWDNPEQQKCFVDNCGFNLKNKCTYLDSAIGVTESLPSSVDNSIGVPTQTNTKVKLTSHRYDCPAGPIIDNIDCLDEEFVLMYPYECKPDNDLTAQDDGEYIYCDEDKPLFNASGKIEGFQGTCSDGRTVTCDVNKFDSSIQVCKQPIYETEINNKLYSAELTRTYTNKKVDVLSGEVDIYSQEANCLRANTVQQAREQQLYVKIEGDGFLDDDIYVLRHNITGGHEKIYCNMQHAENKGNKKAYNGDMLQCIDNNGNYTFNQTVNIETTDIVSVQEATENENATGTPFSLGRTHYSSTEVVIDGVEVAPKTFSSDFPSYPRQDTHLKLWDNTLGTLSILFPFAGAYEIYFYNKNQVEVAKSTLDIEDFKSITQNSSLQLKLGQNMPLATGISDSTAARDDMWVEWGGGVFGGKSSKTGGAVSSPLDDYVKENAVTSIIIKDLLTNSIIPIQLVYPLAYPNRVFISKLKVYEYRQYRCYNDFEEFNILGQSAETKYVCTNTLEWQDYKNGFSTDLGNLQKWGDETLCNQNCRSSFECSQSTSNNVTGYQCTQRGGENLGGDLGGNLFSSKTSCDSACFEQNQCTTYAESNCNIVDEKLSEPVTDYLGKTVYRKKALTYNCQDRVDKQVGCAEYDVKVTQGDIDYNINSIGYETKNFSGNFENALTKVQMLEVGQQHIFSGWEGKCVSGMKWDFSYLSDPMTIMSYAMSAYSSMNYLTKADVGWAKELQSNFDGFTEGIENSFNEAMGSLTEEGSTYKSITDSISTTYENVKSSIGIEGTTSDIGKEVANQTSDVASSTSGTVSGTDKLIDINKIEETIKNNISEYTGIEWNETMEIGGVKLSYEKYLNITQGSLITFGVRSALVVLAPEEQDYITADKLLKGYAGIGTSDNEVQNYNSCMASIGASLPNLIAWSANSATSTSDQLVAPWKAPLRMTPEQLAAIAVVTSENFVTSNYIYKNNDNDILLSVIAMSQTAYIKAAQTICMGTKTSQAAEQIQATNNSKDMTGAIALGIAKAALSMVCAPCGFAATIVMDMATNVFAKVNTCTDEEDAIQWGILDFKTNKFLNKQQCTYVNSECDKKVNFGFGSKCVRDRYEYCCYDQITTKVFAEGLKKQLNKDWSKCNDISVDDLKDISFRECRVGEIANINKCFPTEEYSEFQKVLFRQASKNIGTSLSNGLIDQAINSMATFK
jgi:hypothetical protein